MLSGRFVFMLVVDLTVFLALLLLTAYFGVLHILLLILGILLFLLSVYDYRYGGISALLTSVFNLPASPGSRAINRIPVVLSLGLIFYGFILLLEHGLVNTVQRLGMQGGQFGQFVLWAAAGTFLVIITAVWFYRGAGRK